LENLCDSQDTNRSWKNIKENIKTSPKESLNLQGLKQHKPWFDEEECLRFLDQRKPAKMQWVPDPSQKSVDNLHSARREASKHFRDIKKANLKPKIEELENNIKIKNIRLYYRSINGFKKGYQPRTNIVKDEKGDMVTDTHTLLDRWRNYFSQPKNIHEISDVMQTEIHTAEPLVPEPSASEFELAIEKLKSHKSPGIDQI